MNQMSAMGLNVLNIPDEIQNGLSWGVSTMKIVDSKTGRRDKAPRNPKTGNLLKVSDPSGWVTFEEAVNSGYPAIGCRLTADDPFIVIDIDKSKAIDAKENKAQQETARKVYNAFDSYAERSASKQGVHIFLKGSATTGRRRDNIEIYSQGRYIICTGDILKNKPIAQGGDLLEKLYSKLNEYEDAHSIPMVESDDERQTDEMILKRMFSAQNGKVIQDLFNSVPSQTDDWSKLDSRLAQHICFYTRNHQQAIRIFRLSKLYRGNGQKKGYSSKLKYEEDYLLRRTFMRAWYNEDQRKQVFEKNSSEMDERIQKAIDGEIQTLEKGEIQQSKDLIPIVKPEGLLGEIAQYIYDTAPRPVWEIAISGALSMMAGICGRQYNINGSGLGLYIVILAKTGRGKEAANSGVTNLMQAVSEGIPACQMFIGPSQIASGQGLIKCLSDSEDDASDIPSKILMLSEFGHTLKIITERDASAADMRTRQAMLDLFSKNSWGSVINESAYADKQRNTSSIFSPNVTILADTTPELFFKSVSKDIIDEGFLPRFLIVEYDGDRVKANFDVVRIPPKDLVTRCASMVTQVITLHQRHTCHEIQINDEARKILEDFDDYCDEQINNEVGAEEMWNRAHLKALRVAGIYAVGCNIYSPLVDEKAAQWAIDLVKRDVGSIEQRIVSGDFGDEELQRIQEFRRKVHEYFTLDKETIVKKRRVTEWYYDNKYIPHNYFQSQLGKLSSYKNVKSGITNTVDKVVNSGIANGDLMEVDFRHIRELDRSTNIRSCRVYKLGEDFLNNYKGDIEDGEEG